MPLIKKFLALIPPIFVLYTAASTVFAVMGLRSSDLSEEVKEVLPSDINTALTLIEMFTPSVSFMIASWIVIVLGYLFSVYARTDTWIYWTIQNGLSAFYVALNKKDALRNIVELNRFLMMPYNLPEETSREISEGAQAVLSKQRWGKKIRPSYWDRGSRYVTTQPGNILLATHDRLFRDHMTGCFLDFTLRSTFSSDRYVGPHAGVYPLHVLDKVLPRLNFAAITSSSWSDCEIFLIANGSARRSEFTAVILVLNAVDALDSIADGVGTPEHHEVYEHSVKSLSLLVSVHGESVLGSPWTQETGGLKAQRAVDIEKWVADLLKS